MKKKRVSGSSAWGIVDAMGWWAEGCYTDESMMCAKESRKEPVDASIHWSEV